MNYSCETLSANGKEEPVEVLFVDDDVNLLNSLRRSLHGAPGPLKMKFFTGPTEALAALEQSRCAVIVSDWVMQDCDGLEFCRRLRAREQSNPDSYHYVIVLTGRQDGDGVVTALESGADDFLNKPFQMNELLARIRVGCRMVRLHARLRQANAQLVELATVDPLTGVFNRRRGTEILHDELGRVHRDKQSLSVLLIDLDKFKVVNDGFGHAAGDAVLREVVRRVKAACRKYDSVVRWGGDELLVICPHATGEDAAAIGNRLCLSVAETAIHISPDRCIRGSISIGAATLPSGGGVDVEQLLAAADESLYAVKADGGNGFRLIRQSDRA